MECAKIIRYPTNGWGIIPACSFNIGFTGTKKAYRLNGSRVQFSHLDQKDDKACLKPLVSVIIPTYKRADMVVHAVESVLNQTYTNLEVIVVNDNKPEYAEYNTTDQRLQQELNDGRLRIIHTAGGTGGGAARNYAVSQARGEYLAFLDDDDEFEPDKIETQLRFMLDNNLDCSYQDVSWYDADTGKLVEHRRLNHVKDFSKTGLLRAHVLTPISPTAIYMLKTSLFRRTKGFGEVLVGQDWFLMLRCIEAGAKIGYMPEVHVRQYLHKGTRLSLGNNKLIGENKLYKVRRTYFPYLSPAERRYVKFRHYAVLAFASARRRQWVRAAKYAVESFAASPTAFFRQIPIYFKSSKY